MWNWTKSDPDPVKASDGNQTCPLSDDFVSYVANIARAAAAMAEQDRASGEPHTPPEGIPMTPGPDVVHIVIVNEPEASNPVVESTLASEPEPNTPPTTGDLDAASTGDIPSSPMPNSTRLSWRRWVLWPGIGVSATLALLAVLLLVSPLILAAPVTVTIIPTSSTMTTMMQVTLSTGNHPAPGSLAGRALPMLSLTQRLTVPTTGTGHQPAESGHGLVTFYNAAPQVQAIPAGMLLTGKDGIEIVTEADAVIPAGTLATNGQVSVLAQAVNVGPTGNIAVGDLYGACCREGIYVQNTAAFTGGHDAYSYPMVTAQDIEKAKAALHTSLMQSVQAAFAAQLTSSEALITPIPCQETSYGNAGVGQDATSVTLGVSETCQDVAYDMHMLVALVTKQLQKQAAQHLSTRYALSGAVTTAITKVTAKGTALLLTVKGIDMLIYQFSLTDLQRLAQMIAGKSNTEATRLLAEQPGVSQVEMNTSGTLPADASHIHVLVIEQEM